MKRQFNKKKGTQPKNFSPKGIGKGQWRNKYGTGKKTKGKKSSFI